MSKSLPQRIIFKRCPECGVLSPPGTMSMFQHAYECPHDLSDFDGFEDVAYVPEEPDEREAAIRASIESAARKGVI